MNATTTTVTGVRNAQGGCDFTRAGLSTSKDAAHIEIEVAFNASTCQVQYQSGLAPAAPLAASQTGGYMTANQTGASPAPASVVPTTAGFGNSAYQDNQYLDPFGIQTAAQEQWVNWNISGCVTNWSWNVKWSWLNDGWNLNQHAASGSSNCGGIFTNAYAQMSNGIFCNFIQTDYNRFGIQNGNVIQDHLNGFNNGTYGWSYNDEKAGPCAFLLHHGHTDHR